MLPISDCAFARAEEKPPGVQFQTNGRFRITECTSSDIHKDTLICAVIISRLRCNAEEITHMTVVALPSCRNPDFCDFVAGL